MQHMSTTIKQKIRPDKIGTDAKFYRKKGFI
jgi:hypothetical protein